MDSLNGIQLLQSITADSAAPTVAVSSLPEKEQAEFYQHSLLHVGNVMQTGWQAVLIGLWKLYENFRWKKLSSLDFDEYCASDIAYAFGTDGSVERNTFLGYVRAIEWCGAKGIVGLVADRERNDVPFVDGNGELITVERLLTQPGMTSKIREFNDRIIHAPVHQQDEFMDVLVTKPKTVISATVRGKEVELIPAQAEWQGNEVVVTVRLSQQDYRTFQNINRRLLEFPL